MFNICDSECPVCRTMKKLTVKRNENHPDLGLIGHITTEYWDYAPLVDEVIIEGFCPECGIKLVVV